MCHETKRGGYVSSSPAVANGRVYIGCCDGWIYCLHEEDKGEEQLIWEQKIGSGANLSCNGFSSPAVADGLVFVGSDDNIIYALDDESGGKIVWSYTTDGPVSTSPAVANGKVFVSSEDHYIYAFGEGAELKIIEVDDDFVDDPPNHKWDTIQEGVDDAEDGDTVLVYDGTYEENVVVDMSIVLKGIDYPAVDARGSGSVITFTADSCSMFGFKVINSGLSHGDAGIKIESNNTQITDNIICDNYFGIYSYGVSNTILANNSVYSNGYDGIFLQMSNNANLTSNEIYMNNKNGINLLGGTHNIMNNDVSRNNEKAIHLLGSSSSILQNNYVYSNEYGIYLDDYSSHNNIRNNSLLNNDYGIFSSYEAFNNNLTNNNISNNDYGVYLNFYSFNNHFYHNNFRDNTQNAYDDSGDLGTNYWDNGYPSGGNYWNDYNEESEGAIDVKSGPNQDQPGSDGIVDTPYEIPGGVGAKDNYPLMEPFENYITEELPDLKIAQEDITYINSTEERSLKVTVHNIGQKDAKNVTISLGDIWGYHYKEIESITAGETVIVTFSLPKGIHFGRFDVEADPESNYSDDKIGNIKESNEENNLAFIYPVNLEAFSLYDTFYKYENLVGNDSIIIGTIASKEDYTTITLLNDTNVNATVQGKDYFAQVETDAVGKAYFDFSNVLGEGTYEIQFVARNIEEHYLSPIVTKKINVRVIETEVELDLTPKTNNDLVKPDWADSSSFDLYDDGVLDYFVKNDGKVNANIKLIAGDGSFDDAWVLIDPIGYYKPPSSYKVSFGNVESGTTQDKNIDLEVVNGERYAIPHISIVNGKDWANAMGHLTMYTKSITPIVYFFFKDEDGKIHRALDQEAEEVSCLGNSYVFPYSPEGVDSDALAFSLELTREIMVAEFPSAAEELYKEAVVSTLSFEQIMEMGKGIRTLHLVVEGTKVLSLGMEAYKTLELTQEPASESRQIHGLARWAGLSSGIVGVGVLLGGPPTWVTGAIIGGGAVISIGLDLVADHIQKEQRDLEDAYNHDLERLNILHPLNERMNSGLVTTLYTFTTTPSATIPTPNDCIEIDFLNIQISEKNLSVKTEFLNNEGFITQSEKSNHRIEPGDFEREENWIYWENWKYGSYIVRFFVEPEDGSRQVTSFISNGLGVTGMEFLKKVSGEEGDEWLRESVFHPGEEIKVRFNVVNNINSDKDCTCNIEIPKINKNTEGNILLSAGEEALSRTVGAIKIPEDAEEGWYTVKVRLHEVENSAKLYDVCEAYRFYVLQPSE